jgi:hypothetical protein
MRCASDGLLNKPALHIVRNREVRLGFDGMQSGVAKGIQPLFKGRNGSPESGRQKMDLYMSGQEDRSAQLLPLYFFRAILCAME